MRSRWKLPLIVEHLNQTSLGRGGYFTRDLLGLYRRVYNGQKFYKQKIRPTHFLFPAESYNYQRRRRGTRQRSRFSRSRSNQKKKPTTLKSARKT